MKTFKLHLIRHGMTAGNLQGLYIGSGTDLPLCDEGRAQLAELKERFVYPQVDTVFSSPCCVRWRPPTSCFPGLPTSLRCTICGRPVLASLRGVR